MIYNNLPRRKIISSPFPKKEIISHGIIGFCKKNNKFLMIKPRFTTSLKYVIFGAYRIVYLLELLQNMTKCEIDDIQSIIKNVDTKKYNDIYFNITGSSVKNWYGYFRLIESSNDILDYNNNLNLLEPPYEFPKGKSKHKEDSINTATREFHEEVGHKLVGNINSCSVDHYVKGLSGRNYKIKYWICELSNEINLNDVNNIENVEIKKREWIDLNFSNLSEKFPTVITSCGEKVKITSETLELIIKSKNIIYNLK